MYVGIRSADHCCIVPLPLIDRKVEGRTHEYLDALFKELDYVAERRRLHAGHVILAEEPDFLSRKIWTG